MITMMMTVTWKKKMVPPSTPFNMVKMPNSAGFCNHCLKYLEREKIKLSLKRLELPMNIIRLPHRHRHDSNLFKYGDSSSDEACKDERQDEKQGPLADLSCHLVHLGW